MKAAHGGAVEIVIDTFPNHHTTSEGLHAVAEANYPTFASCFWTEDPHLLKRLFLETFLSSYDSTAQFFERKPSNCQELKVASEDERLVHISALFNSWYAVLGAVVKRRSLHTKKRKR